MKKQVKNSHYDFLKYNHIARWSSYYYQIKEILSLNQSSLLEIGPGSNILKNILNELEIDYASCDIANDLNPDYLQDVSSMKINRTFDMICVFQILEHLPFNLFEKSLISIKEHSNRYVLISLPRCGPKFRFSFKFPKTRLITFGFKLPRIKKFSFDGQHYWEMGARGRTKRTIEKIIKKHFIIQKNYTIPENGYHQMFVLQKK